MSSASESVNPGLGSPTLFTVGTFSGRSSMTAGGSSVLILVGNGSVELQLLFSLGLVLHLHLPPILRMFQFLLMLNLLLFSSFLLLDIVVHHPTMADILL